MQLRFGAFEVDTDRLELRRDGLEVPLEPQAFDVLVYLLTHRDRVVPKEELMDELWGSRFVSETAVTTIIKQVRRALGDDGQRQDVLRTTRGRGYRFVAELGPVEARVADPVPANGTSAAAPPSRSLTELVERQPEVALLEEHLQHLVDGRSGVVVIKGPAGIGKTALLDHVRQRGSGGGVTVLRGRGSTLEREFGFGVVRQLFDAVVFAGADEDLFSGGAHAAARVFGIGSEPGPEPDLFALLQGLFRLTSRVAHDTRLLVCIDDVQWCDVESLRYLAFLQSRLDDLPVLVVMTQRTGEEYDAPELIDVLSNGPATVVIAPAALTEDGTARLVGTRLGGADDAFALACHEATGGNPLLLRQLTMALRERQVSPDLANVDQVRAIGSRAIHELVTSRLRSMPALLREVAATVAVLGDGCTLHQVSAVTGQDERRTAAAVAGLARQELLRPSLPLGFVHPLVGAAVYQDLAVGDRELRHQDAARMLTELGASEEQVAAHLLVVPPKGDAQVAARLRVAARVAAERGALGSAVAHLTRALAEPPAPGEQGAFLAELAGYEAFAGQMEEALEHAGAAYAQLESPHERAETAVLMVRASIYAARQGVAESTVGSALTELPEDLVDERQELLALALASSLAVSGREWPGRPTPTPAPDGDGPGARALAAMTAWEDMTSVRDRERAVRLGWLAVSDGILPARDPGLTTPLAAQAVHTAGEDTRPFWEPEIDAAFDSGSLLKALSGQAWWAQALWQEGDLRGARQQTEYCVRHALAAIGDVFAHGVRTESLVDAGELTAARAAVEGARELVGMVEGSVGSGEPVRVFREAEARLLLAEGRHEDCVAMRPELERLTPFVLNPGWRSWRRTTAAALHALGRSDEAMSLLDEDLALAERWGADDLVGRSLVHRAALEGSDAEATLRRATGLLEHSRRRLDLARARTALADLVTDRGEARDLLVSALELARSCHAHSLVGRLTESLRRVDVDAQALPAPPLRLTVLERRVARLASAGVRDEEIALQLFLPTPEVSELLRHLPGAVSPRA